MSAPRLRRPLWAVTLSTFLGPGAGQIYNRDFGKGMALILATLVAGGGFLYAAGSAIFEIARVDPMAIEGDGAYSVAQRVLASQGGTLAYCSLALTVLWVVGIVDAFLSARRKSAGPPPAA